MAEDKWTAVGDFEYKVDGTVAAGKHRSVATDVRRPLYMRADAISRLENLRYIVKSRRVGDDSDGIVIYNKLSAPQAVGMTFEDDAKYVTLDRGADLRVCATASDLSHVNKCFPIAQVPSDEYVYTRGIEGVSLLLVNEREKRQHTVIYGARSDVVHVSALNGVLAQFLNAVLHHMMDKNVHVLEILLINLSTQSFTPFDQVIVRPLGALMRNCTFYDEVDDTVITRSGRLNALMKPEIGLIIAPEISAVDAQMLLNEKYGSVFVRNKDTGATYIAYSETVDIMRRSGVLLFPYGEFEYFRFVQNDLRAAGAVNHIRALTNIVDFPLETIINPDADALGVPAEDEVPEARAPRRVNPRADLRPEAPKPQYDQQRHGRTYFPCTKYWLDVVKKLMDGILHHDDVMTLVGQAAPDGADRTIVPVMWRGSSAGPDNKLFYTMQQILRLPALAPPAIYAHAVARIALLRGAYDAILDITPDHIEERSRMREMFFNVAYDHIQSLKNLHNVLYRTSRTPDDVGSVIRITSLICRAHGNGRDSRVWFSGVDVEMRNAMIFLFGAQLPYYHQDAVTILELFNDVVSSAVVQDELSTKFQFGTKTLVVEQIIDKRPLNPDEEDITVTIIRLPQHEDVPEVVRINGAAHYFNVIYTCLGVRNFQFTAIADGYQFNSTEMWPYDGRTSTYFTSLVDHRPSADDKFVYGRIIL